MAVKVAINGFGRIGRLAFRQMFGAEGYEVVAINDLTDPKMLAHLLKYDTAQGGYAGHIGEGKHTVEAGEDSITVDGKKITIYKEPKAADLPWGEIGVDVVLECTGFYCSKDKAQAHIDAGAKKDVYKRQAKQSVMRALTSSYAGRKERKRQFRQLWIARINAAARINGLSYSKFMYGLKLAEVDLNRKVLSDMAINDAEGFAKLAELAKSKLA